MEGNITRDLAAVWLHVHDISLSALAAAVVTLGLVILLELRSVMRLRQAVESNLARVFEQLDLLRFESQQLIEGQQLIEAHTQAGAAANRLFATAPAPTPIPVSARPAAAAQVQAQAQAKAQTETGRASGVYQNAAALATSGAPAREIAERYGLATGEARLLSSLAQARGRRDASEPARA
ncbi:MAG TPA: hypothetical protein VHX52_06350 [Steroidobacteraceae bacterium]|jgi:hypothetical protein|nr:hypothetical protein [Steroidobacteraceae bacterium]